MDDSNASLEAHPAIADAFGREGKMSTKRCLVRAYADEPLDRVAVAFEKKLVFVVHPSLVSDGEYEGAIGFPRERVHKFDAALFEKLLGAFMTSDDTLESLWGKARPLEADLPQLERAR